MLRSQDLKEGQCIVIVDGSVLLGDVAVWRYPAHVPWDLQLMNAVKPRALHHMPDNCIIISRQSKCLCEVLTTRFN